MMKHAHADRRIRRTTTALTLALTALMEEQAYDTITIQAILDRADVGRSTFYSHFYDKDDLLHTSIATVFEQLYHSDPHAIVPSLILFDHVYQHRILYTNLARSQRFAAVLKTVETTLSRLIEQRLGVTARPTGLINAMIAPFLAGSFINIIDWWLKQETPDDVEQLDATFRILALTGIEHALAEA